MTSKIKVDNINKVSDDSNIIKKCGTTITLGASGDSIALASGASQTGFGRTGTVDWQTTPKTATFTSVNGEGYFINSGSAITANLPAGSAGAIVAFSDYARNFETYNLTINPNGSEKIGGIAQDAILNINGQAATFVYVDSTKGWVNVQNAEDTEIGVTPAFVAATGGTPSTSGDFKIHTFTGPGTFSVSNAGNSLGSNTVSYMVVAGGGGGGFYGGGGGAGGFREGKASSDSYTASPLNAPAGLPVSVQSYSIVVGGGGPAGPSARNPGTKGTNSSFSTITSTGGGFGGSGPTYPCGDGGPGGSGGSGAPRSPSGGNPPGLGNTPPVSPPQGQNGGISHHEPGVYQLGGGGGGAGAVGGVVPPGSPTSVAGAGGAGVTTEINASPVTRAGGGGGGSDNGSRPGGAGGAGGGGGGGQDPSPSPTAGAGTVNTGGGGGGGGQLAGGAGGSGIVIIRYKFQ